MFNVTNIIKLTSLLILTRRPVIVQRNLNTAQVLYKESKKQDIPKIDQKNESPKQKKGQRKKSFLKSNYYNFFCKCSEEFTNFDQFLEHIKNSHQIENPNFSEILTKRDKSK